MSYNLCSAALCGIGANSITTTHGAPTNRRGRYALSRRLLSAAIGTLDSGGNALVVENELAPSGDGVLAENAVLKEGVVLDIIDRILANVCIQ